MDKQLFWTSNKTAQGFCYDEAEFVQSMTEFGLTPSPLPELPVKVNKDGLVFHARRESVPPGRIIVTVSPNELW